MTDEFELAKSVADGNLEMLCTDMRLLRCPSYHDVLLQGTGVLRTSSRGRLSFQMVAPIKGLPDRTLRPSRPHGEVYEIDDHVILRAVDYRGREWSSNPFLAKPLQPTSESPNWVVRSEVESLFCGSYQRTHSEESEGRIYVPRQRHLPFDRGTRTVKTAGEKEVEIVWSSDHHVRQIGGSEVVFRAASDDWLMITARRQTPVMSDWAGLMCHAVEFATAGTARPAVAVREFNASIRIGIFSGPFEQYRSYLTPPLIELWSKTTEDFWSLIQRFFEWAQAHETERAQLFSELDGIRSGASGSIQTACLTLAVGIESLAGLLLKDEQVVKDGAEQVEIAKLLNYIDAWEGNQDLCHRARSMLGSMGRVRAVDRLYAFARRTGVPDRSIKAWKDLRDMKAHGRTTEDDQKLLDLYYSAVELLYRLVCYSIGYTGLIAETSRRGWGLDQLNYNFA